MMIWIMEWDEWIEKDELNGLNKENIGYSEEFENWRVPPSYSSHL